MSCFNKLLYGKAVPHAQRPIPGLVIWIRPSQQMTRTPAEIRLYFLPIEKGIIPSHDSPLHQKGCRACNKRRGKGSSRSGCISAVWRSSCNIHARSRYVRLYHIGNSGKPPSGKIRVGLISGIIGPHRDYPPCRGGNGKGDFRHRKQKTCPLVQSSTPRASTDCTFHPQFFPESD